MSEEPCLGCGEPTTTRLGGDPFCSGSCKLQAERENESEQKDIPIDNLPTDEFETGLELTPHPNELALAINKDHIVRFSYYNDDHTVTFCVWGESDEDGWPGTVDGELRWRKLELPEPVPMVLVEQAGETRFECEFQGATVWISASVGRSKHATPAWDAPVVDETGAPKVVTDGGHLPDSWADVDVSPPRRWPDRVTPRVVDESCRTHATILEVQRDLRVSRKQLKRVLTRLDLSDRLAETDAREVLIDARYSAEPTEAGH